VIDEVKFCREGPDTRAPLKNQNPVRPWFSLSMIDEIIGNNIFLFYEFGHEKIVNT